MTVLVTGAAGFIGSRLSRRLLDRGTRVVGLDNMDPYYALEHKTRHLRDLKDDKNFTFVQADLRDDEAMVRLFAEHKPTHVAHLGGLAAVRYSITYPLKYGHINV